jgi:hypothetical protein
MGTTPISTADVVGAPRAASGDGKSVVIAYLVTTTDGFELVATSVNASGAVEPAQKSRMLEDVSPSPSVHGTPMPSVCHKRP